ncbi:GIY-YIG nuclease family protein [Streptomyces zaomyceticus]|uniref:GIY-YIG nuclease family protein n=1 Tax=Streptomyces zaomyceticus TaxID=68286 RepID=UPI0037BAE1E6
MTSFVYMIGEEGSTVVKIGKANNPAGRLASLQTGNPTPLTVMCAHEGGHPLENHLHTVFAPYRVRGEWFDLAPLGDPVAAMQQALAVTDPKEAPAPRTAPASAVGTCACGHGSGLHETAGCTVAGWDEAGDCQCETFVPQEVLSAVPSTNAFRLPRAETSGWVGPSPAERSAAYGDPRYRVVLAEAEQVVLPNGVLALAGFWPEALAANTVWRLREACDSEQRLGVVLDEALRLQWPDGMGMMPGVVAEGFARRVVKLVHGM